MPRGGKSKYTEKQKRRAHHIKTVYIEQGDQGDQGEKAEARAWGTVDKLSGGGK